MNCPFCGSEIPEGITTCPYCNASIDVPGAQPSGYGAPAGYQASAPAQQTSGYSSANQSTGYSPAASAQQNSYQPTAPAQQNSYQPTAPAQQNEYQPTAPQQNSYNPQSSQQNAYGQPNYQPNSYNQQPYDQSHYYDSKPAPVETGGLLAWSIITILLCTIPGIVALVNVLNVNKVLTLEEQQKKLSAAKLWCIIGTVLGILYLIGAMAQRGVI